MSYSPMDSFQRFEHAHRQAMLADLLRLVGRHASDLVPFDAVRTRLRGASEIKRGTQFIPLRSIVGSVGRYRDFTREFLPRDAVMEERWRRLDEAVNRLQDLPPIDVYKVGDVYFVSDGNHRVSVARANGAESIEANVTEIPLRVSLTPEMNIDEVILSVERAEFGRHTGLEDLRPQSNVVFTVPGRYEEALQHIEAHRWYLGEARGQEVAYADAVTSWFDNVYLPAIEAVRHSGLLKGFPKRTEADLYLWTMRHLSDLQKQYSPAVDPEMAAADLARQHSDQPLQRVVRAVKRRAQDLLPGEHVPPIVEELVEKLARREREEAADQEEKPSEG
jgi:hypothetical protein